MTRASLQFVVSCLVASLFVAGCAGADRTRDTRSEADRLRERRDRAFEDIDGPREPDGGSTNSAPSGVREPSAPVDRPPLPVDTVEGPTALSGAKPDWVPNGISSRYPAANFIVGIGSFQRIRGRDDEAIRFAEDRARDTVAKQIEVHLRSEFRSAAAIVVEASSGSSVVERDTRAVTEHITSSADMSLKGLQIAERWYDAEEQAYWALAVLDRALYADEILDKMKAQIRDVTRDFELGMTHRERGSALQAMRYLSRAQEASLRLLAFRGQLRAVSPAHADSQDLAGMEKTLTTLWKETALAAENLRVSVLVFAEIDGEPAPQNVVADAEAKLSRKLRARGLHIAKLPQVPQGADFEELRKVPADAIRGWLGQEATCLLMAQITSKATGEVVRLGEWNLHYYRAGGNMILLDVADGRIIASAGFAQAPETQHAKRNPQEAAREAAQDAIGLLCDQLAKELPAILLPQDD